MVGDSRWFVARSDKPEVDYDVPKLDTPTQFRLFIILIRHTTGAALRVHTVVPKKVD